jgi:hypothetical protein
VKLLGDLCSESVKASGGAQVVPHLRSCCNTMLPLEGFDITKTLSCTSQKEGHETDSPGTVSACNTSKRLSSQILESMFRLRASTKLSPAHLPKLQSVK